MEKRILLPILTALFLFFSSSVMGQEKKVEKSFSAKPSISILTVSGDCLVYKGETKEIVVSLTHTYPTDCFDFEIKENTNSISVSEKFNGRCKGQSEWLITVPQNTEVDIKSVSGKVLVVGTSSNVEANTASGSISIQSVNAKRIDLRTASGDINLLKVAAELSLKTASGNIAIEECTGVFNATSASGEVETKLFEGELTINSASGDATINKSKGIFTVKTASGEIVADDNELSGHCLFSSASGDVEVSLSKSQIHDLKLSSASGDVVLKYNGTQMVGIFEFTAKVDKGKILSPVKFDKEEVINKNGDDYDVKSFTLGNDKPLIILKTASGLAKLVK